MREQDRSRIVIELRPHAAVPPSHVDQPAQFEGAAAWTSLATGSSGARVRRYFTSVDEWAVPRPDGPPSPLPGSEKGARYFVLEVPPPLDSSFVIQALRQLDVFVADAYVEPPPIEPPDQPSSTVHPDDDTLSKKQGYLRAVIGIDAEFAWQYADGTGATLTDIEQGWMFEHEDLPTVDRPPKWGDNRDFHSHGTSVLAQIVGRDNEKGVIGIAPRARARVVSEWRPDGCHNVADATLYAVSLMHPGEVLLLESQMFSCVGAPDIVPVEVLKPTFEAIQKATSNERGIVVVEAAGNGGVDLDLYQAGDGSVLAPGTPGFRQSGAILVAAASSTRGRLYASNFGRRIDCFAWGEKITTADASSNGYTNRFGRTSGASAIVAGAALLLQSWRRAAGLSLYTPPQLRELLSSPALNTRPAPETERIGVMPNLRSILEHEGE